LHTDEAEESKEEVAEEDMRAAALALPLTYADVCLQTDEAAETKEEVAEEDMRAQDEEAEPSRCQAAATPRCCHAASTAGTPPCD
jgi:hypothetical protein